MKKILLITALSFFSCVNDNSHRPKVNDSNAIDIDIYNNKENNVIQILNAEEYIDSVKFIKLKTSADCYLKNISKVFFENNTIIVYDSDLSEIFIFDIDGNYLRKISKKGRSKGEYITISTLNYNEVDSTLIIYDNISKKLIHYDLNGTDLKVINNFCDNATIFDIINLPNNNYLCYMPYLTIKKVGEKYSGLWEVDSNGKYLKNYFTYNEDYPCLLNTLNSYFYKVNENIYLTDTKFNNLYHYSNNQLNTCVKYNIIDKRETEFKGKSHVETNLDITCISCQVKKNIIFSQWFDSNQKFFYSIYDLKQNKFIPFEKIENRNEPFIYLNLTKDTNLTNGLLFVLNGSEILHKLNDGSSSVKEKEGLQNLVAGMNKAEIEEMNPILEIIYLK